MREGKKAPRTRRRAAPLTVERSPVGGWPIAAALAVAALMLYAIRYALLPFVFAIAIAFVVDPAVKRLADRGLGRAFAAGTIYLLVIAALGVLLYSLSVELASDATAVMRQGDQTVTELLTRLIGPDGTVVFGTRYSPGEIVAGAGHALAGLLGSSIIVHALGAGITTFLALVLLVVLLPYFMISEPRLAAGAIWLIPPERRASVEQLLPRLLPVLRRYFVGVLVVVGYTAAVAWLGFALVFALPHALMLSVTVGLLEIIPVVGPLSAAILAAAAAFRHGASLSGLAGAIAFIVALRLSIDNLVGPLVLGQAARVHPVVVMFGFVCGAMLFGAIGLLLAVPVAVTVKTALQHYYAEPIADERGPCDRKP